MAQTRLRVYVAGPYSASHPREIQRNVDAAVDAGIRIWQRGHYPYVPHLTHYVDIRPICDLKWKDYIQWDREWLRLCDALLYLGPSEGADMELKEAESTGKQIFRSLDEIPFIRREGD